MAGQIGASPSTEAFDYEILGGDVDQPKNVASPYNIRPWIDPVVLQLSHRIGHGPFGDVWIATHHRSTADYDENHEDGIKMLHPLKEDEMKTILGKVEDVFFKCRDLRGVCFLHGISIINGKVKTSFVFVIPLSYASILGIFPLFKLAKIIYIQGYG